MKTYKTQDGSKLEYLLMGKGQPLMLLHGFTEKGSVWISMAEKLQSHFTILIPFLPTSNAQDYNIQFQLSPSMDSLAEYIHELAATIFENKPFHFVGHSMGGYIGFSMANMYPEIFNTFTLFHSSAYADSDEKKITRQKSIDFIKQQGAVPYLKQSITGLFGKAFKTKFPEQLQRLINDQLDQSAEILTIYLKAMKDRADQTSILKTYTMPFLFIAGREDMAVPLAYTLEQKELPQHATVVILEQSGHMGMYEEPDLAYEVLQNFLIAAKL